MIKPIPFTGIYKVNSENWNSFSKFQEYALDKESEKGVVTILKDEIIKKKSPFGYIYKAEQILIVPPHMDADVETFCANNGISYKKYDSQVLLNPDTITSRIAHPPKGYKKVSINVDKLEKLAKNQNSNFGHCKHDYEKNYSKHVNAMMEEGEEFSATTLIIRNHTGNDDLRRYVEYYGADNLNKNQTFFDFLQRTDEPDHCIYFALKNMGIKEVPVYVDDETYEAASILGLL